MISGQRCLVLGRVNKAGEFLEVSAEGLRALVVRDAELSEIVMRAFILRRLALITNRLGNVILMGSRHSAATLHLREFLGRNGHPYTYDGDVPHFDLKAIQQLLRHFVGVEVHDCLGLKCSRPVFPVCSRSVTFGQAM
jgi:thioredoxin reductase (NADPH)